LIDIRDRKLGLYEKALPAHYTWEQRLMAAKEAGFDFLEISIDETDERMARLNWNSLEKLALKETMQRLNMPILTLCLSGNRRYPIGSESDDVRDKGIALIKNAVDFALDIGVRIVQLAGYDEYNNPSNANTRRRFYEALLECTQYAENRAVMLACETMENDLMDSIEKAMEYVKSINSPWFKIYPDIGNQVATGQDIDKEYRIGKDNIVSIHLKDTLPGIVRNIGFGNGIVDFVSFFKLLCEVDYRGLFVIEMWTDETDASVDKIREARAFILEKIEKSKEKAVKQEIGGN